MENKIGSVVAIEPSTGEILAFVSSPSYDPNLLTGRNYSKNYQVIQSDSLKPLFSRPLQAMYPPGSMFKTIQALVALEEGKLFAGAIARSATTGMDLYQGELGRALVGMTSIGGTQMQNAFRDISDFATNNLDMDTELFNTKITAMFSGLDGIMTDRQEKQLQIQANNGDAGAKSLLTLISGLSGVVATEEAIANARRDTETGLKNNELALWPMGAPKKSP